MTKGVVMKLREAEALFRKYMFTTSSGTLVIDRHDFKSIIKQIYDDMPTEQDMFKKIFEND